MSNRFTTAIAHHNSVDLMTTGWDFMPGVSRQADGLQVGYLGRRIVKQDGSVGQADPAVNLYGTHLQASGSFEVTAVMKDIRGAASLRLYDAPPVIQDEFRIEPQSLEILLGGDTVTTNVWPAYKKQDVYAQLPVVKVYPLQLQASNTVVVSYTDSTVKIAINGTPIATLARTDSATSNAIWFGLTAINDNDHWTLGELRATTTNGAVAAIDAQAAPAAVKSPQGLQVLATNRRPGFLIGAAMALGPAVADVEYAGLAFGGDFGVMTTENALKWQFIEPQPGLYDFHEADAMVALAEKRALAVHGHTLVFGEANPQWVQALPTKTTSDKAHVKQVMLDHIGQTVSHFKGRIASWDVVNEPLAADDSVAGASGLRQHIWYQAMGVDYVAEALHAARAADPQAKLYINDFGLEADGNRWSSLMALVTALKLANVPLDGIGFEAHVYESGDEIDPVVLRRHIQQLAQLGLSSRISEMDVYGDMGSAAQAEQYSAVLDACLAEPTCVSWSTWGVTDRYNMWLDESNGLQYGRDLLWDAKVQPTAAQVRLRQLLAS